MWTNQVCAFEFEGGTGSNCVRVRSRYSRRFGYSAELLTDLYDVKNKQNPIPKQEAFSSRFCGSGTSARQRSSRGILSSSSPQWWWRRILSRNHLRFSHSDCSPGKLVGVQSRPQERGKMAQCTEGHQRTLWGHLPLKHAWNGVRACVCVRARVCVCTCGGLHCIYMGL